VAIPALDAPDATVGAAATANVDSACAPAAFADLQISQ